MKMVHRETKIRKQQIIDAAKKLIIDYGSEHVTIRNIANEVGISEAAIYRHFKNKSEMLSFLADSAADYLLDDLEKPETLDESSPDFINDILQLHISRIESRRGMSFLVLAEILSFGDAVLNEKVRNIIQSYIERLSTILGAGVKSGSVRKDLNLGAASMMLFGMIQGLVDMWFLEGFPANLVEKYRDLWEVYRTCLKPH